MAQGLEKTAKAVEMGMKSKKLMCEYVGVGMNTLNRYLAILHEELSNEAVDLATRARNREFATEYRRLETLVYELNLRLEGAEDTQSFLSIVKEMRMLSESKRNLLGLDKPKKTAMTDPTGEKEYTGIPREFKQRMVEEGFIDAEIIEEVKPTEEGG